MLRGHQYVFVFVIYNVGVQQYLNKLFIAMMWVPMGMNSDFANHIQVVQMGVGGQPMAENQNFYQLQQYCQKLQQENQRLKLEILELTSKRLPRTTRRIKRRQDQELEKKFHCPFGRCKKEYASQLALNLHMKLKHNAGSKRQREHAVSSIIRAHACGLDIPQIDINLPPQYIQYVQEHTRKKQIKKQKQYSPTESRTSQQNSQPFQTETPMMKSDELILKEEE